MQVLQNPTYPPYPTMFPHSANFSRHGPHSTPAYENQPPPSLHPKRRPPTISEESIDAPLQMHHHNVASPTLTTMPASQHYPLHQSPNPVHQQQGVTLLAAIGQHATPYRHREDKDTSHRDASPHAFSPPDGSHPHQLRSWYSQDSSYTSESLHQMQLNAAKRGETQGLPRIKRVLSPSESLPLNFKREHDDSDEEENVTKEIREIAGEVMEETSGKRIIKTDFQKPFDPNLVCPTCKKQFRIGEIQRLRRHAKECGMK